MDVSIWRTQRFLLYALGSMINFVGSTMYGFALPLMVLHLTGSVAAMGIMTVCATIPRSLCGLLLIGPLVDRISRRVVLISALSFQAICSMIIAILYSSGVLQIWMLYILGALIMIGHEFMRSADFAVVPAMFGERKLEAQAGLQSAFRLSLIIGPILGGFMLAYTTYSTLLWVNAISYLGPVVMCIWTRVPHENLGGVRSFGQVVGDLREGMVYLAQRRVLLLIISVLALSNLAIGGNETLMIFHLQHDFGLTSQQISWVLAMVAVGSLGSSLIAPRLKHFPKQKLMFWGLTIASLAGAMYLLPVFWVIPIALILAGLGLLIFIVAYSTLVQDSISNEMLGRVGSTVRMIEFFTIGVANSYMSALAEHFGAPRALLLSFLLSLLPLLLLVKGAGKRNDMGVNAPQKNHSI